MLYLNPSDLSKAFDTLNHRTLIEKLKALGLDETAVKFFASYLTGRRHGVSNGKEVSSLLPNYRSIPQGSLLGPILFIVYSVPCSPSVGIYQYVDDTCSVVLHNMIDGSRTLILTVLKDLMHQWLNANFLVTNKDDDRELIMSLGLPLPEQTNVKYLGLNTDPLKWEGHIEELGGKLSRTFYTSLCD